MFVINTVALILYLYDVTVHKQPNYVYMSVSTHVSMHMPFSAIIQFLSRTPKCPGPYPWEYAYPRLGITVLVYESNGPTWICSGQSGTWGQVFL
jgi:hypothetical protein